MFKPVKSGKRQRYTYARIEDALSLPNLIEIQKNSYDWFISEGLKEVFQDISPIQDFSGNLTLAFEEFKLGEPKWTLAEARERDTTYAAPLKVTVSLYNKDATKEIKKAEVYMGNLPLMTAHGTFVVNGAERVIVSQLVRSPGLYFNESLDTNGNKVFDGKLIPNRGAWIEFETDANNAVSVRIDRNRKLPLSAFLRALGKIAKFDFLSFFADNEYMLATLEKDTATTEDEALLEIYKRHRPGEPPSVEHAVQLVQQLFFDGRRYDLASVGRYKLLKKLGWKKRLFGMTLAEPLVDDLTGEIILENNTKIDDHALGLIEKSRLFIDKEYIMVNAYAPEIANAGDETEAEPKSIICLGDVCVKGMQWEKALLGKFLTEDLIDVENPLADTATGEVQENVILPKGTKIDEMALAKIRKSKILSGNMFLSLMLRDNKEGDPKKVVCLGDKYNIRMISYADILTSVSYLLNLMDGIGAVDDIDHLGNRRLRSVGELLQNQFRIGLIRMEKIIRERMTVQQEFEMITPQQLINNRPVDASIREFFGSSQLSQFMDQTNPLAELTHKRRLSALGPGGLTRERAGFDVRDVHHSHYGRMCPIETPEGPNIGLIGSLATYARVNQYGFIETPYRKVDKRKKKVTDKIVYMTADDEDLMGIAQANEPLNEDGWFVNQLVTVRWNDEIILRQAEDVDYMDVSPKQIVSVATAMIPFLEHDDANRALMGANMQRQAVPLLRTQAPLVGTGIEAQAAHDSGIVLLAKNAGVVERVTAREIEVRTDEGKLDKYKVTKFRRSNQGTCINQKPLVSKGERVEQDAVLADGPSTDNGELALGYNILVGFMPWEGYNYEDAILLSEKFVKEDIFTSIHIEEYECEARDTKLGKEEITRDIPNVSDDVLKDLDDRGIIRIGAEVRPGDILVGKVTPKGETELTAEERLLRAIFGEKAREVRDTSLKVPHGEAGKIVDIKIFTRENGDELSPGVDRSVRVYIAQKRKISEGDKMAGRHGNKGVVSRILPEEDMPFLEDGTPLQIVLNPLGVPSRMNIGQALETHLGWTAAALGMKIRTEPGEIEKRLRAIGYDFDQHGMPKQEKAGVFLSTPVFDGATEADLHNMQKLVDVLETGKVNLYDGRTGERFDNPVTVGYVYMLKLLHLVDDKIHARSTGPYSLVTQQPLGGKAQFGGQRFGEMEVWALEAYGAAYTLQELLTVKSDDVIGRVKTYEAIVKGENVPEPGVPESFKVLIKELQSIGLDVKILSDDDREITIRDNDEDIFAYIKNSAKSADVVVDEANTLELMDMSTGDKEDFALSDDVGIVDIEGNYVEDEAIDSLLDSRSIEEGENSDIVVEKRRGQKSKKEQLLKSSEYLNGYDENQDD